MDSADNSEYPRASVRIDYHVSLPPVEVEKILKKHNIAAYEAEGDLYQLALDILEREIRDNDIQYLDFVSDDPDVDADF